MWVFSSEAWRSRISSAGSRRDSVGVNHLWSQGWYDQRCLLSDAQGGCVCVWFAAVWAGRFVVLKFIYSFLGLIAFVSVFWICVKEFAGSSAKPFLTAGALTWEPPGSRRDSTGCCLSSVLGYCSLAPGSAQPQRHRLSLAVLLACRHVCTSLCTFSEVVETVDEEVSRRAQAQGSAPLAQLLDECLLVFLWELVCGSSAQQWQRLWRWWVGNGSSRLHRVHMKAVLSGVCLTEWKQDAFRSVLLSCRRS